MLETVAAITVVSILAAGVYAYRSVGGISSGDAHGWVEGGALLLDVRTPAEFEAGHIDGALNIPLDALPRRLETIGDRERRVVVYCRSGARSGNAQRILERAGFTQVRNLGAMSSW